MDRQGEYLELLQELSNTPLGLEHTITRAQAKISSMKRRRFVTLSFSSLASLLIAFVLLVNLSVPFAQACGRIPLLKELTQLVAFSPSLTKAIENEYVQPIEIEQTKNGITVRIEYVIVDQKQLEVFYSIDAKQFTALEVTPKIKAFNGDTIDGYSLYSSSYNTPNKELRRMTVDFMEKDMPGSLQLFLMIYNNERHSLNEKPVPLGQERNALLDDIPNIEPDYIAEFTFLLEFDPSYTSQGKHIILDKTFDIGNQKLNINKVEIYPTHLRLNLEDYTDNTAWLKSLDFYLEDEKGNRFQPISNGITGTAAEDTPMMESFWLESPFFYESMELTAYITGATWLDKKLDKIALDLKNTTTDFLPEGVLLEDVEKIDGSWLLTFSAREFKENHTHQIWSHTYYDEEGEEYLIGGSSTITGVYYSEIIGKDTEGPRFIVKFAIKDYPYDIVYLSPAYSWVVKLSTPIKIKIK
ncbi:MAG: DUF4179 domain-containing protein [Bacillota bacterium]